MKLVYNISTYYIGIICLILSSCSHINREFDDKVVARLGENELYQSELDEMLGIAISGKDSVVMARNYIHNWARKELVLEKAAFNLTEDQLEIEKLVEAYRHSLIRQQYEQDLVRQYLDTTLLRSEIEGFYETHKFDLKLDRDLLQVLYVKINKLAPRIDELKDLCVSDTEESKRELDDYCFSFAKRYYNSDTDWLSFDELYDELPVDSLSQKEQYENNFLELEDSLYFYFLRFKKIHIKEEKAPIKYLEPQIRKMILLKRKQELIRNMESTLFNDAIESGYFEMY